MRKKFGLIAAIIIGTTTSLQVAACTDDSKYKEFTSDVDSGHAFFGILGAADNPLSKQVIDGLHTMQQKGPGNTSSTWDKWLTNKKTEIDSVATNGTIDINIFEKSAYANPGDIVSQFWNDKSISWQKQIYHWLLDHKVSDTSAPPVAGSGVNEITTPVDKDRAFKTLPIVFIVNKGKLVTVGQEWGAFTSQSQFFNQLTNLIYGNLLINNNKN